jgi:predicted dehydrogenase
MSMRLALLGAGEWGELLASVLADPPGVELAVVCDPDTARAMSVAEIVGGASTGDVAAVMEDVSIDAVVIASPEDVHAAQAESALRAGKHAMVEKPVALTSGEAWRLADVARETGRVLMPGHILRFVPAYAAIRERLPDHTRVHSVFARRNVPVSRFSAHQRTPHRPHEPRSRPRPDPVVPRRAGARESLRGRAQNLARNRQSRRFLGDCRVL